MQKRKLGSQGLQVSAIGLGCMGMSFAYGKADEAESLRVLDRSLELGVDFWDTAEIYGPFTNEILLARALQGRRKKVVLATKFAWTFAADGARLGLDGSRENMRRALEGSLKRLGTDFIDLFYLHRMDPNTPIEETVAAMSELVREGKVRYIGLSEVGPQTLRKAHAVHPISALQSEYSLWETPVRQKLLPVLQELGIGLVAYSPFGRGFISGSFESIESLDEDDIRRKFPRFQPEHVTGNLLFVEALRKFSADKGITLPQLCLSWLLSQGENIVPIPGTTRVAHLEEDLAAAEYRLTQAEKLSIDEILNRCPVSGPRLPDFMMKLVQVP